MILFTDLDNTLIYSYKHDIGTEKRKVELCQGREISYLTEHTFALLKEIKEKVLIVPTTTRTIEQYERIDFGLGGFKFALTVNGGILLIDGKSDENWYKDSLEEITESREELERSFEMLDKDTRRSFELRFINDLFVFTKCEEAESVTAELKSVLDGGLVDVFSNGEKVYILPKKLNKGRAVERFMKYLYETGSIAAGDSEFDVSMLKAAGLGIAPAGFRDRFGIAADGNEILEMPSDRLFSEAFLEEIKVRIAQWANINDVCYKYRSNITNEKTAITNTYGKSD